MEIEIDRKLFFIGLGAVLVVLIVGGLIYFRFFMRPALDQPIQDAALDNFQISLNNQERTDGQKIKDLEDAMSALIKQVASIKSKSSDTSTADLNNLQAQIGDLQNQINLLKTGQVISSPTTTTTTSKSTVYIPLGSGGTYNNRDWESLSAYEVSIDPVDYPGYTSMQLEVIFRLTQIADAGARLINYTDSSAISGSDVYTQSDAFSLHTSGKFTLAGGRKTYRLQVKSPDTYDVIVQTVRIKVNF